MDIEHENSNRFEEYEWCGQKRIRATTLLEGGFRGTSSRHMGGGAGGLACAGYPSVESQKTRAGDRSSVPPPGNCSWQGSFVAVLPACDVHIKMEVFGWGNGIVKLQARSDKGGSRPRVIH